MSGASSHVDFALRRDEPVAEGVRRISCDLVDAATSELTHRIDDEPAPAVHDARKACKMLRGLVRLVEPVLERADYRAVNGAVRDAASELSSLRDASATHHTFAAVVDALPSPLPEASRVADRLAARAASVERSLASDHPRVVSAATALAALRPALAELDLVAGTARHDDGWATVAPGLGRTYRRGRRALTEVRADPSDERFHDWRKQAKYTWYHVRLLEPAAPIVLGPLAVAFHDLSEALGDAHDMVVLGEMIRRGDEVLDGLGDPAPVLDIVENTKRRLERRAVSLGLRLDAEPADRFVRRMERYWRVWRRYGDEIAP